MNFDLMQRTVDIVHNSPHPANKVAATLFTNETAISDINHWPAPIVEKIGTDTKIGNSSGTIHAETSCLIKAMHKGIETLGANLFITDPPCPNCAKNIAEAGIQNIYIDHKGFEKDFAQRRGEDFKTLSIEIFKHAAINIFEIFRKDQKIIPIFESKSETAPLVIHPPYIENISEKTSLSDLIITAKERYSSTPFSLCIAHKPKDKNTVVVMTESHPSLGYNVGEPLQDTNTPTKYSPALEPANRLLMLLARHGLLMKPGTLYASNVPTSRELVNIVGAHCQSITIGNLQNCRDEFGLKALQQLENNQILKVQKTEEL